MKVIFYDIIPVMALGNSKKCNSFKELLRSADYVSLHVPLTPQTINLIDKQQLDMMKPGAYLLNLSRGKVVNLDEVYINLINDKLGGFAADVFPIEPKKNVSEWDNILQKSKNTILTPHIGGSTEEAQYSIGNIFYKFLSHVGDSNFRFILNIIRNS